MSMLFSIVIPFRGKHDQIRGCLDELANQIRPPVFEATVVDDGCEIPVPVDLENEYAYPLRIIHQVALGISAARNRGMRGSGGQVILFLDSDVSLDRDLLANLAACIDGAPNDNAF